MRQLILIFCIGLFFGFTACQTSKLSPTTGAATAFSKQQSIQKIIKTTEKNICNPHWLKDPSWVQFVNKIQSAEVQSKPWPEFIKHFNREAKQIPFTHFYLLPLKRKGQSTKRKPPFELSTPSSKIAHLNVRSFAADATLMKTLIDQIKAGGYEKLIIDLRNNTGGTLDAAVVLGQFLTADQIDAGLYLSRRWFAKHNSSPAVSTLSQFPYLQDFTYKGFGQMLSKEEGFRMVIPAHQQEVFKGEVVILTNQHTASTCEPLVHLLKQIGRATIIGQKTAGAMLSGRFFKIDDQVRLFLPVADYMTGDGLRIDKKGVTPDVEVPSAEALTYTMDTFFKN